MQSKQVLYNGIAMDQWPPRLSLKGRDVLPVPYLENPPEIIPIDVGRQLFVDDFLIEKTDLVRSFHSAQKHPRNPILSPETPLERAGGLPVACPKSGGVWWDPQEGCYRMWYEAGWLGAIVHAVSDNGLDWIRPDFDIEPETNRVLKGLRPDSTSVVLDHDAADPAQRFKMLLREPDGKGKHEPNALLLTSPDGVNWSEPVVAGPTGDRTTMFFNPFRKRWVFSLRSYFRQPTVRIRDYVEREEFFAGWKKDDPVPWTRADHLDLAEPGLNFSPQLYNVDAIAYESIMLGVFQIMKGPENGACNATGLPKITELFLAYSRDGFHWSRPHRQPFIAAERQDVWDRGYIQPVGGICNIVGNSLRFYYIGFQGDPAQKNAKDGLLGGLYANGHTGLATLRRDGFASMDGGADGGSLVTRPLRFSGDTLYVNLDAPSGSLRVEVLDEHSRVVEGFSAAECVPLQTDSTRAAVKWSSGRTLADCAGPVRFRFVLQNGSLYAFWVSASPAGCSAGYVAAGGPGFSGNQDL